MKHYLPPHEVKDEAKLQSMIEALQSGKQLPAIITLGEQAFTGSHRIAAWEACEMEVDAIEITDEEYKAAVAEMGLDWEYDTVYDYNEFCWALNKVTKNGEVKKAIKDQMM